MIFAWLRGFLFISRIRNEDVQDEDQFGLRNRLSAWLGL
jgi:hypothetical protein